MIGAKSVLVDVSIVYESYVVKGLPLALLVHCIDCVCVVIHTLFVTGIHP